MSIRKVVSTEEGYTFLINDDEFVCYETGKQLTGEDVAKELKISRSAVSQNLKKTLKCIFYTLKRTNKDLTTLQVLTFLAEWCGIKAEKHYKQFFRLFPKNIRKDIYTDAFKQGYIKN